MPPRPPRILVLQLKRIGDLILTAPALAELRAALPEAEVVMLAASNAAELARCIPSVSRVIPYRARGVNMGAWTSAVGGPWDACLDFTGTDRSALLAGLSRARRRIGYAKFAANKLRRMVFTELCAASVRELHTVDFHRALVDELVKTEESRVKSQGSRGGAGELLRIPWETRRSARVRLAAQGITGRYAIVHPGTAKREKFWPVSRWAEVIGHVHGRLQLPVVLTGAADGPEREHLVELKRRLRVPVADLTGCLGLAELAALIGECGLMAGVDSMAMHLAALFGRPQVALFGPTNPFHWRPRHEHAAVLIGTAVAPRAQFEPHEKRHEMKQISTAAVIGAIESVLAA